MTPKTYEVSTVSLECECCGQCEPLGAIVVYLYDEARADYLCLVCWETMLGMALTEGQRRQNASKSP